MSIEEMSVDAQKEYITSLATTGVIDAYKWLYKHEERPLLVCLDQPRSNGAVIAKLTVNTMLTFGAVLGAIEVSRRIHKE